MPWQDRIRQAAYVSPSGQRFTFDFEDVTRSQDRKTNAFEYPDGDGTFVQDLGSTSRRYPVVAFFWGDDYDIEADAFEAALAERGAGVLEHPIYGRVDVVPFGTIERSDRLKTAGNQAAVSVLFYETTGVVYPDALSNPADAVVASVDAFNEAAAAGYADSLNLATVAEEVTLANQWDALVETVDGALNTVAAKQAAALSQYEAIKTSINTGIDVLVKKPLTLARQAQQLAQTPARIVDDATARLDAYGNLARNLSGQETEEPGLDNVALNLFLSRDLNAGAAIAGQILSTVNSDFVTQGEAISAADAILSTFDDVVAWRDASYPTLGEIDTGDSYQKLQDAVALAAGFAIQLSFTLKREQRLVLSNPRSVIDLVAELYGTVDDQLDFFINSNNLTGPEILEIPAGREVVYYI